MLDIGKLIPQKGFIRVPYGFSSMLDIGKLIQMIFIRRSTRGFSSMLDIGKLILQCIPHIIQPVLAQCWI